ncbi:MAG TPA: hypothetical protein VFA58_03585 [Chthoniobacterales bacterium]|nr:hypothetical protein [Chthoniobacterales bacterium]
MKFATVFALVLLPLLSRADEPIFPTTEGLTWHYEMKQERPAEGFDLTEPNEEQEFEVSYRLGATEKIDNAELRRLEVYRGEKLENVDLIAIEERGIMCPARRDAKGNLIKLVPPQQMLSLPLKAGVSWNFDGTVGETKVSQRYQIAGEEDVQVPAGKFHAWRITCAQLSPSKGVIERWFVPGVGFVKIDTAVKGASGGVIQKTSLKLKEAPKVAAAPEAETSHETDGKLSAGVSNERNGQFKTEFKSDVPAIYARWVGHDLKPNAEIKATFIAESVADTPPGSQIDDAKAVAPKPDSGATFTLAKPEKGWIPGDYRVEFFVNGQPAATVKFKIVK